MKFEIVQYKMGTTLTVELQGDINESVSFSEISFNDISQLVLNTKNVEAINSWGVKEWIKWVRTFPKSLKVTMVGCATVVVDHMNLIGGFLPPNAEVKSFFVPYFCSKCQGSGEYLFEAGVDVADGKIIAPKSAICENCGSPAAWDVIGASYFKFLTNK